MVSICIPAYNHLELFKQCVNSVLSQDFKDYELIVSDDSSHHEIENYVKSLGVSNLKYIHNTPSLGAPQNWNNAMSQATRKYIKILHHDDYFTRPDSLRKFVEALEANPAVSFAFCYSQIYFKKQKTYFIHKQTAPQLKRLKEQKEFLFFRNIIGAPSATFFKNDPALKFDPAYTWLVDVAFYMRYLKKHPDFVAIPEALVTVVDGEEAQITQSVSNDVAHVIPEHLQLFSEISHEKLNAQKTSLFFQELFSGFNIGSFDELQKKFRIPSGQENFLQSVFKELPRHALWKAFKKRLLTSRYNKRIFKIERF